MTSHRGRRRIPRPTLPTLALPRPMLAAGAVAVVVSLAGIAGVEASRHDPVSVVPVGSVVPLPTPVPSVSPVTGVAPVRVCWLGSPAVADYCVTQDPRDVVTGDGVTR